VLLGALLLAAAGVWALRGLPIDALPDLSDTQVIIRTSYPGQAPRVVEDQVTYPLASAMLSVPRAATVRGYSLFGDSFIYVLFRDGTNPEQARAHVLESLVRSELRLPAQARPALEPDATGVGWITNTPSSIDRAGTISRSCAPCRTGPSSPSCRLWTALPKPPRSAGWRSSTRWSWIRCACRRSGSRLVRCAQPSRRAIARAVAR